MAEKIKIQEQFFLLTGHSLYSIIPAHMNRCLRFSGIVENDGICLVRVEYFF